MPLDPSRGFDVEWASARGNVRAGRARVNLAGCASPRGRCGGTGAPRGRASRHRVSVLARSDDHSKLVWGAGYADVWNILQHPERLCLGEHEHLEPVGLSKSLTPFGPWTAIRGYDGLLKRLGNLAGAVVDDVSPSGHDRAATVVAVPYDFRQFDDFLLAPGMSQRSSRRVTPRILCRAVLGAACVETSLRCRLPEKREER